MEVEAGALQVSVVGEDLLYAGHFPRATFNLNGVGFQVNGNAEGIFQQAQVLVTGTKEEFDLGSNLNVFSHLE